MKKTLSIFVVLATQMLLYAGTLPETVELTKAQLYDKIKGGWAGQFLGCTYGVPTEFKFKFKIIPDDYKIEWNESLVKKYIDKKGDFHGAYDDVYLDITFMNVYERLGFNAPRREFKKALSEGKFELHCANAEARTQYLDGVNPDEETSWRTNTYINDIDFQIEADYAGLMSPALPNAALKFCKAAGKAINASEGYYCGALVATMYSLAFAFDNPRDIVEQSMKILPEESETFAIVSNVLQSHKDNNKDWKFAWKNFDQKFCKPHPKQPAIYAPYNMACVLIGLLYGEKDFTRTADISTRCGLDSDCNPATACGILGVMIGYSSIPEKWAAPLQSVENTVQFMGTTYTLAKVYSTSYSQAIRVLAMNGVKVDKSDKFSVKIKSPKKLPFEKVIARKQTNIKDLPELSNENPTIEFEFEGNGILVRNQKNYGYFNFPIDESVKGVAAKVEIIIDSELIRTANCFMEEFKNKRNNLFEKHDLPYGKHKLILKFKNAHKKFPPLNLKVLVYKNKE